MGLTSSTSSTIPNSLFLRTVLITYQVLKVNYCVDVGIRLFLTIRLF